MSTYTCTSCLHGLPPVTHQVCVCVCVCVCFSSFIVGGGFLLKSMGKLIIPAGMNGSLKYPIKVHQIKVVRNTQLFTIQNN